jgi:hypothetical protein
MDTNAYVAFLVVGVLLVIADGQVIYRSGRRYLERSYGDAAAGASMTRLVTVLFHLAVLGLLALLSTIDMWGSSLPGVVGRIGVLLLVLAVAHGITIAILSRIRDEQVDESIVTQHAETTRPRPDGPTANPVPAPGSPGPVVSPSLDYQAPYSTPER